MYTGGKPLPLSSSNSANKISFSRSTCMALLSRRRNVSCQSQMWVLTAHVKWLLLWYSVHSLIHSSSSHYGRTSFCKHYKKKLYLVQQNILQDFKMVTLLMYTGGQPLPCEWPDVRRSKVMRSTPTRYNICININDSQWWCAPKPPWESTKTPDQQQHMQILEQGVRVQHTQPNGLISTGFSLNAIIIHMKKPSC